ncbi:hypothetical protein [Streptomyces venezuelae]|uniref:hypothetical protein n=1 Tax=Streptomyces venezuelae TaxID=54571 RepID=UPI00123BDE50|nr:hypothetical protein [Streptomyces venezuelae]
MTDQRVARWRTASCGSGWVPCGRAWDAVAISPLGRGVDALAVLRISPRRGYPVLADHVQDVLYVMVPPGTGHLAAGVPGVRVLSTGAELVVPWGPHGSPAAHWVSPPREDPPPLVQAAELADVLQRGAAPSRPRRAAS